jgi:hypothetical protein
MNCGLPCASVKFGAVRATGAACPSWTSTRATAFEAMLASPGSGATLSVAGGLLPVVE